MRISNIIFFICINLLLSRNLFSKKDPSQYLGGGTELNTNMIKIDLPETFHLKTKQNKIKLLQYLDPIPIDEKLNLASKRIVSAQYPQSSFLKVVIEKPFDILNFKIKKIREIINENKKKYVLKKYTQKTQKKNGLLIHLRRSSQRASFDKYISIFGNKKYTFFVAALYPTHQNEVLIRRLHRAVKHSFF